MQNIRRLENKTGNVSWQIDFSANGQRIRKSYQTLKDAKLALSHFNVNHSKGIYDDPRKYEGIRLNDLIHKYESVYGSQRAFESKLFFIARIREKFDGHCLLSSLTYDRLQEFRNDLIKDIRKKRPRSNLPDRQLAPATVNRIIACLRHMLTCAVEQWNMMPVSPFKNKPSLMLKENNQQKRYLTPDEIKRLLAVSPQHLQDVCIAAINSGMRRTELLTLTWQQIKWDEGIIELPETKSGEKQDVYLNEPLIDLFKRIRRRPIVDSKRVFIWQDFSGKWKPIKDVTTAFKRACKAAGIKYGRPDHVTFHTLRHTYGSHLVMRGATIYEVRDLMRHVDVKTTERYAHLSDKAKRKAAELLDGLTG